MAKSQGINSSCSEAVSKISISTVLECNTKLGLMGLSDVPRNIRMDIFAEA